MWILLKRLSHSERLRDFIVKTSPRSFSFLVKRGYLCSVSPKGSGLIGKRSCKLFKNMGRLRNGFELGIVVAYCLI